MSNKSESPKIINQVIETRTERVWLRDDGIIQMVCFPNTEHSLNDAIENIKASSAVGCGTPRPALIDLRGIKSMNREARTYYAGKETAKAETAAALIIDSPVGKVIGNFFMGLNKPVIPTRLFTSESEAVQWLKGFLK